MPGYSVVRTHGVQNRCMRGDTDHLYCLDHPGHTILKARPEPDVIHIISMCTSDCLHHKPKPLNLLPRYHEDHSRQDLEGVVDLE
jgi:hypothetical protein